MRIYTRTGDAGETGLIGGRRVSKSSARIWAVGEIDELNACLGLAATDLETDPLNDTLGGILADAQHRLFDLGAEIAAPEGGIETVRASHIALLEQSMDHQTALLEPLRNFILPGGSRLAAQLHLARCVCRRAERRVVELGELEEVRPEVVQYLNRLSDWLFTAARTANRLLGVEDVKWEKGTDAQ